MREQGRMQDGRGARTALLGLGLAAALGVAAPAVAAELAPDPHAFGMVGLARFHRAILSAVLTNPPDPGREACRVTLSFVDAMGRTFRDRAGTEVKETFALRDGVAVAVTLHSRDVLTDTELRKAIRPVTEPEGGCACEGVVASWEIANPAGVTTTTGQLGYRAPPSPDPPCRSLTSSR